MKKAILLVQLLFISSIINAQIFTFSAKSCYQNIVFDGSGSTYNVLEGTSFEFYCSHPVEYINVYDLSMNLLGVYELGEPVTITAGEAIYIDPWGYNDVGELTAFFMNPNVLNATPVELMVAALDGEDCIGFDEMLDFSSTLDAFEGLCDVEWSVYNPYSGNTENKNSNSQFSISADGYCTPPPGTAFSGGKRCMDVDIIITFNACSGMSCPPLEITKTLNVCCNDCKPYNIIYTKEGSFTNVEQQSNMALYPNPAQSTITLSISYNNDEAVSTGNIYNLSGQLVHSVQLGSVNDQSVQSTEIDVNNWPAGIYILQLEKNGVLQETKRFSVVH